MGPRTSLIVIDGVLRKTMGGTPIDQGRRLYIGLANTGRIILLSNSDHPEESDWLELHGIVQHDLVYSCPPHQTRAAQANELRRMSYDIDMVVVADPAEAHGLIRVGFNTLLFTHSQYSVPEWRPDADKGVRPWDDITKQVADLAKMKAQDARLRDDD